MSIAVTPNGTARKTEAAGDIIFTPLTLFYNEKKVKVARIMQKERGSTVLAPALCQVISDNENNISKSGCLADIPFSDARRLVAKDRNIYRPTEHFSTPKRLKLIEEGFLRLPRCNNSGTLFHHI